MEDQTSTPNGTKVAGQFSALEKSIADKKTVDDRKDVLQHAVRGSSKSGLDSSIIKQMSLSVIALFDHPRQPSDGIPPTRAPNRTPFVRIIDKTSGGRQPAAQDIFQGLLCRSGNRTAHSEGCSSLVFSFATLVSLSLSRPQGGSPSKLFSETSPSFDLSPLYGINDEQCAKIRMRDGSGMLAPDCFCEDRLAFLPPQVTAMLIVWNRNHNYIARRLLEANEKEFTPLEAFAKSSDGTSDLSSMEQQDDKIFKIARSINCFHFKNAVIEDFCKGLLGLPSTGPGPKLDLDGSKGICDTKSVRPHHPSYEFSQLYSWSSLMSDADETWVNDALRTQFKEPLDKITDITPEQLELIFSKEKPTDQQLSTCGTLKRGPDGRFADDDLAKILLDATDALAGPTHARSTPPCFKVFDEMMINEARRHKVCSLNQFRSFLGLKPFKEFREWNSDAKVCEAARRLYGNIDELELYPGLQAEECTSGGFGFGYTKTYALLMDLITAIRNDPRFMDKLDAGNLTKWGLEDSYLPDSDNGAYGAMLPKVLLRNLSRNYTYDNIYGLFPFIAPITSKADLIHLQDFYTFDRPQPIKIRTVDNIKNIGDIFNDPEQYLSPYGRDLKILTSGYGYMLGFDNEKLHDNDQIMTLYSIMPHTRSLVHYGKYYSEVARELIENNSTDVAGHRPGTKAIDIVRDVINPTCVRFVTEAICGLPMSTSDSAAADKNNFTDFAALYSYVFRKADPPEAWAVRTSAFNAAKKLTEHIERQLQLVLHDVEEGYLKYFMRLITEYFKGVAVGSPTARSFLDRLAQTSQTAGRFRDVVELDEYQDRIVLEGMRRNGHLKKSQNNDVTVNVSGLPMISPSKVHQACIEAVELFNQQKESRKIDGLKSAKIVQDGRERLERLRLTANVLGLSVVAAVNYAQACSQAVDFYLDDKRKTERDEIIRLATSNDPLAKDSIMGYIREAMRLGQPLGLFRIVKQRENITSGSNEVVFANLTKAHSNPHDFNEPEKILTDRKVPSLLGMGLHKCPATPFMDKTMPDLFKTIFRLENLRRAPGRTGKLTTFNTHPSPRDTDPRVFIDSSGELTSYPRSLLLHYDKSDKPISDDKLWKTPDPVYSLGKKILDAIVGAFILLVLLWLVYSMTSSVKVPGHGGPILIPANSCKMPKTVFQRWSINAFVPGLNGQPSPIRYTLDHKKPHLLSLVDIDARDMQMAVLVDGVIQGLTTEFELDKSDDCGEDYNACISRNFSAGMVVIPSGKHSVQIVWHGKEFIPGTTEIDWQGDYSRRLMWQLEYCS
ncbi:heme peroxidase [Crucibulum laeve]|uniref:Heme peroxidase n=1 Tax=Crucibulum laeve TaxID=68775 RepID=A0A5C3M6V2_9AGAR|nr:heme peroxidase [Crucibulum laeve]